MLLLNEMYDLPPFIITLGYLGLYIYFISLDQITPVPNEISLLTIGFLCSKGTFNPVVAGMVSLAAFTTIDLAYYYMTGLGNKWSKKIRQKMEHSFLRKLTNQLKDNFPKSILVLCFIPRMRFWAPVISKILQVPVRKFLKYDLLSLSLFTSLYLTLGFYFHKSPELVLMEMETLQNILFITVITLLTVFIINFIRKRHLKL